MFNFLARTALTVALVIATYAFAAQEPAKPILGVVTPNQTTLNEVKGALKAKGCQFKDDKVDGEPAVIVASGCFQLPGEPEVAIAAPAEDEVVTSIMLRIADLNAAIRKPYQDTLESSYGEPKVGSMPGFVYRAWHPEKSFVVTMLGNASGPGGVAYWFGKKAEEAWSEIEPESKEQPTKDLGTL